MQDQRPVHGKRMNDPQLLKLAHEREVGIDVAVPAAHLENALRLVPAFLLHQRGKIFRKHRVVHGRDKLGVVVIVAEKAVPVGIGPDADVLFPETVGRAVLAHLADGDLARAVGVDVVGLLTRGIDRGLMHE